MMQASAYGYLEEYYNLVYDSNAATLVSVIAPNITSNINFTMNVGGIISGHVYRSDGITPVVNATVCALTTGAGSNYEYYGDSAKDGSYTITGLYPGNYRVWSSASGYITEYYKEVYYSGAATAVNVTVANDTPDINFTMEKGGVISGHIYQSDGLTPIIGASIYASSIETGDTYSGQGTSASDGSYTITGLRSGNYNFYASAKDYPTEYYNNIYNPKSATPVSVTAPNSTSNINFTMYKGGSISGHVYNADGAFPANQVMLTACLVGAGFSFTANGTSAADGSYTISNLISGSYRVRTYAFGYINEYNKDVYDPVSATLVYVTAPNNTPDINFTLDKGGTISGHVYRSDGITPVTNSRVYAYLAGTDFSYISNGFSTADGSYTITGLVSGNYLVQAYSSGYLTEYYKDAYKYNTATLVNVTAPSNTPDINFTLDLASQPQYTVIASADVGGMISPYGRIPVNRGEDQTFNITPNPSYGIASVLVDSADLGPISSYTFGNVSASHSIQVTFIAVPIPSISGGSGGAPPPPIIKPITTSGFMASADLKVDAHGIVQNATQLQMEDGKVTLDIPKNTSLVDSNGKALDNLSASKLTSIPEPPPPQAAILTAYEFGPDGAQFNPPLTLTLKYDPKSLPANVDQSKVTLAFWDGSKWITVESTLDIATNTLTAQVSHFSMYALLAELAPAKFALSGSKDHRG